MGQTNMMFLKTMLATMLTLAVTAVEVDVSVAVAIGSSDNWCDCTLSYDESSVGGGLGPISIHTKEGSSFPEFTIPEAGMFHFKDGNYGLGFGVVELTCQTVPPTGGSCVYMRFIQP